VVIGGVRKSRLAIALGYTACQHSHSVLFASAIDIVNTLAAAQAGASNPGSTATCYHAS
jgi:DNA replication protein DnaC